MRLPNMIRRRYYHQADDIYLGRYGKYDLYVNKFDGIRGHAPVVYARYGNEREMYLFSEITGINVIHNEALSEAYSRAVSYGVLEVYM